MSGKHPPGCVSVDAHEAKLTALADELEAKARELLGMAGDGRVYVATGKELAIGAIRARKQASDLANARADRDYTLTLIAHEKAMSGIGRRPLKRRS